MFSKFNETLTAILDAILRVANAISNVAGVAEQHSQKWLEDTQAELLKAREELEKDFNYE